MLQALPSYVDSAPFAAWVFAIARNYVIDRARTGRRTEAVAPGALSRYQDARQESHETSAVEQRDAMRTLIAPLSIEQQRVLSLIYSCGLSVREVSRVLGRNESWVRQTHKRARDALREIVFLQSGNS
jgi:RNA polymerase sigma factor (sigma-70 family)